MNGGELTRELVEASAAFGERSARAERIAAAIRRYGDYRWVGIYDVRPDEIAVGRLGQACGRCAACGHRR